MKAIASRIKQIIAFSAFTLCFVLALSSVVRAAEDLPLASSSTLTGVAFDDRPLSLPVERNFQMAMLTTSSELGRSCGRMESYGWRMNQSEQARVNEIFTHTVDRLRALGYTVAPQTLTSVAKDVTVFTADRSERHFMFLWSAGDLGLVMTLCETAPPVPMARAMPAPASVQVFPSAVDVVSSRLDASPLTAGAAFTPLGKWEGGYICSQGPTGGTLEIDHVTGQNFSGIFKFYPNAKSGSVPSGSYTVNGQYDKSTGRVLINPGKWIKRPPHYYNTVMVGKFDAANDTLSAFFQGVSGCTSFEARHAANIHAMSVTSKHKAAKKHKAKKKVVAKKPDAAAAPLMAPATAPAAKPSSVSNGAPTAPVITSLEAPVPPVMPAAMPTVPMAAPSITAPSVAAPAVPVADAAMQASPVPAAPTPALMPTEPAVAPANPQTVAPLTQATPSMPVDDKNGAGISVTVPAK